MDSRDLFDELMRELCALCEKPPSPGSNVVPFAPPARPSRKDPPPRDGAA